MIKMSVNELEDHDFEILESYWLRFGELSNVEDERKKLQAENIKKTIEQQYNESDGLMRAFIETAYFGSAATQNEAMYEAEEVHGIKRTKYNHIRKILLRKTAEGIGWV